MPYILRRHGFIDGPEPAGARAGLASRAENGHMDDCCAAGECAAEALRGRQSATLRRVLATNAAMFAVELAFGLLAGSVALLADSLDMLGDALVYGFSLYAVGRGRAWKARAAVAKAAVMGLFGAFVLGQLVWKLAYPQPPAFETMGAVGALALAANAACFGMLWRHRGEDINMRSVWICSRNDLLANVSVLLAAALVWWTRSPWPDLLVGALICALFLRSALLVAREARAELRAAAAAPRAPRPGADRRSMRDSPDPQPVRER